MLGFAPACCVILAVGGAAEAGEARLTISNPTGKTLRGAVIRLDSADLEAGGYRLSSTSPRVESVAFVAKNPGGGSLIALLDRVPPGGFSAELARDDQATPKMRIDRGSDGLSILCDEHIFTKYILGVGPKPFFFPLIGPSGERHTRAFPMERVAGEDQDHPHQRSFWFTHGNVNGVDFWSEQKGHGFIEPISLSDVAAGQGYASFRETNRWLKDDHSTPVCDDERTVSIYADKNLRIIDTTITISAKDVDVTFGDTKEGAFGVRVASSMDVDKKRGGKIVNSEGLTDGAAWGKPAAWVDYTGPVNGKIVGIMILNHPESFRFPTTWHVRGYGLFAANPFGWRDFGRAETGAYTLPKGQSLKLAYRVILHAGELDKDERAALFEAYAHPPTASIAKP